MDRLKPYARNAKIHSSDQVTRIAASMAEFGWTVPCLVADDGELIAGHGRVLAAAQLGLSEAPVIVLDHLTEAQRRAYRIADNKLTELGGWDEALLLEELRGLLDEDFDLGLIGIPEDELDALLHEAEGERAPIDDDSYAQGDEGAALHLIDEDFNQIIDRVQAKLAHPQTALRVFLERAFSHPPQLQQAGAAFQTADFG